MNSNRNIHQQAIFDSTGLLPRKNWKTALWHTLLLVTVVFLTEIGSVRADMVFDFQMKLAKKGNAEAQFKVGEMYETGRGVEKNMDEAMKWINKAAAQGNKAAGYNLLYKDLQKNGVTKGNKAELDELKSAAKGSDGYAQYYLGKMHANGVGVKKNTNTAIDWLGKASLVGVTAAETEITRVNEASQSVQLQAKKDAERKARAQKEAKRKDEERKRLEAQRQAEQRKQQEAAAQKRAEQDKKLAAQREAERKTAEKAARQKQLMAQREAEAERKRQAVLEQRKKKEEAKKATFESDPCAGKSARFLSTCK
ncbi:MAG: SEL1-like repeat protein [Gammaproteobacteria bacterium]|nr:SEL1-like repeat protein [Gammaproteobacteria bacterium]